MKVNNSKKIASRPRERAVKGNGSSASVSAKRAGPVMVARWRLAVACGALLVLAALLVGRLLMLQVLEGERGVDFLLDRGDAISLRSVDIPAHRGMILDRHGKPLAVSTPVVSIWANPQQLKKQLESNPEHLPALAAQLGLPEKSLSDKLKRYSRHQFVYLKRQLPPREAEAVLGLGIKGVYEQNEYRRYYPEAEVTSHVVGFTNIDDRGQEGLERAFDGWLRGVTGKKRVLKDLHGKVIREIESPENDQLGRQGRDLTLSIDLRLQYLAYRELKAALQRTGSKAGSVVMVDAQTGEVLAMVNQPAYNPNDIGSSKPAARRNRAATDMFEPGSTIKPLTLLAALESGKFESGTVINTNPGYIQVGRKTLLDPVNYGELDLGGVLKKSSQVGTTKVALALQHKNIWDLFSRFGLGETTATGFPGESSGLLPVRDRWSDIERANFGFGYGLTVTTLQLAQAYAALANDGVMRPLTLIHEQSAGEERRVAQASMAHELVDMLEQVTLPGGTATQAQVAAYRVAGKTGTVHKAARGGYSDSRYMALFAGLAPASDPRIVTVVTIDEPAGKYHGGEVAAPVFSKVTADAMRLLNIKPDGLAEQYADGELDANRSASVMP